MGFHHALMVAALSPFQSQSLPSLNMMTDYMTGMGQAVEPLLHPRRFPLLVPRRRLGVPRLVLRRRRRSIRRRMHHLATWAPGMPMLP